MDPRFTAQDATYVLTHFSPLEQLCVRRAETPDAARALISRRLLPAASYILLDGTEMYARDLFALLDAAGSVAAVRQHFGTRYSRCAEARGVALELVQIEEAWDGYLTGEFGVCLRDVTPENIFIKERLVTSIATLLADPEPGRAAWCASLRMNVEALDALEKPFTLFDRHRFGRPVSRETLIDGARARYPEAFACA